MKYDWRWDVFLDISPDGIHSYLQSLAMGTGWTIALAVLACCFSLLLGSVLAVCRTCASRPLNLLGACYVELFRNIPLLVQMFLWYFVLPELLPTELGRAIKQMPQPWGQFVPALLCLSFYGSSRIAETLRAGIQALPRGQMQAAMAIGLTTPQVYRYVILPEAYRVAVPTLTSEFMGTVKYSSVALTIGLLELTGQARAMQEFTFHIFEAFSAATLGYFILNGIIVLTMRTVERRIAVPGMLGYQEKVKSARALQ